MSSVQSLVLPEIATLIPHAQPMVLLDRVLEVGDESLIAEVTIRPDSLFCGADGVGAWVGIEYMAQTIAAHAGYEQKIRGEPIQVGFLLGSRRYDSHCGVFAVGCVLHIHVERVLLSENGLGSYECRIHHLDELLATATVTVFSPANAQGFLDGNSNE